MALVTRNAIRGGLGEALTTSAGILTGVFFWALAAVVGVAAVHLATGIVWLPAYAWLVTRLGNVLQRPAVARTFARLSGAVLAGLGFRLAFEHR